MSPATTEPRYRIAHVNEWEPETWDDAAGGHPALYQVRYYNPANECENFPFGHVGPDHLATIGEIQTFTATEAAAMLAEMGPRWGRLILEPADSAIRNCP